MKNLRATDSGYFTCQVEQNDISGQIYFGVKLLQNTLKTPVILEDGLQHVTKGSSLHIKCSVNIGIDNNYVFYWSTPRNSVTIFSISCIYFTVALNKAQPERSCFRNFQTDSNS